MGMNDKFIGVLEWEHYGRRGYGPRPIYKGGDRVMARLYEGVANWPAGEWEVTSEARAMGDGRTFVGVKVTRSGGSVGDPSPRTVLEWDNLDDGGGRVLPVAPHVVTVIEDLIAAYREVCHYAPSQHRGAEAEGGALGAAELLLSSGAFVRAARARDGATPDGALGAIQ